MKFIQRTKINYLLVISITIFLSWAFFSKNEKNITLILNDNAKVTITGDIVDKKMSQSIFNRQGRVIQIQYNINEKILFNHKA